MDSATPFQPWTSKDGNKTDRSIVDDTKHRENVNHPKHTRTASYEKEQAAASGSVAGPSSNLESSKEHAKGKDSKMDSAKIASMQQIIENTISPEANQRIKQLLEAIETLNGPERLFLYLKLPTGGPAQDPLKQPINPLGSRAELQQTVTWIQTHLEVDPDVSLPKQDVYDEYITHCMSSNMKPLSTADFGKVMKQVYPTVRPRRLGTRGNSRYCYAGLRKRVKLEVPQLPDLGEPVKEVKLCSVETEKIICEWAENKIGMKFSDLKELSQHLQSMQVAPAQPPVGTSPLLPTSQDDTTSRQLIKQLKRKIQTHGTPGRPKKYKQSDVPLEPIPSTSLAVSHQNLKLETELEAEPPPAAYAYPDPYGAPPPLYETRPPFHYAPPPRAHPTHDFRSSEQFAFEAAYAPRDLSLGERALNLSSDASLDLSTEGARWQRRRPPEPPPRVLPGKKLILEAYQSEAPYLPKKMRAAESLGQRHAPPPADDSPKNASLRTTSSAAALARDDPPAANLTRHRPDRPCCGVDAVLCAERHAEILNRERVISICNIDKHDLDDYLNEPSRDNEEELLHYFQQQRGEAERRPTTEAPTEEEDFLEAGPDPQDDRVRGKSDKITQLRELLVKNLKGHGGSGFVCDTAVGDERPLSHDSSHEVTPPAINTDSLAERSAPDSASAPIADERLVVNGEHRVVNDPACNYSVPENMHPSTDSNVYNGNCHNSVPQSPTTRTQQYDFVPISDGCQSPGNFNSKSPLGFTQANQSPSKANKSVIGRSLQTSPVHSSAASPFVSPRITPVPRSRLCSRPIPKLNGRKKRLPLTLGIVDNCHKQFAMPNDQKFFPRTTICAPGIRYCQPSSAPPSPNIVCSQYRQNFVNCATTMTNGHGALNFIPSLNYREMSNGELTQPLSADPLSSEVSQFFQEPIANYRPEQDSFRSQSVPLKQLNHVSLLYNSKSTVGSVPPTPVPTEFCDFSSLTDTCDISKAGLNSETLDKIYDAIDSSNGVLSADDSESLLNGSESLTNGCDLLPDQQMLPDELNSLIPNDNLLDRNGQYNATFNDEVSSTQDVEEFLKRTNSVEIDLTELVNDKGKYYNNSRSVPSTPVPYKRTAPNLQIDSRRSRQLFTSDNYTNGNISKSVPSTPQMIGEKSLFSYSNRDFLINGNSVDRCPQQIQNSIVDNDELTSPLHEMMLEPLTPAVDLLADLDKMDAPYVDL